MSYVSSFEILAQNLVPTDLIPSGPQNPFLVQGYFVQVSLISGSSAKFNVIFEETTKFTQGLGKDALQAQVINADGEVELYDKFFASTGNGYLGQQITFGQTLIYGVQCIPGLVGADVDAKKLPQAGTGWRGTVRIEGASRGELLATATQRLVYYTGPNPLKDHVITACVYGVPAASTTAV
ncbi:MAG: hypothetical protein AAFZ04_10740 [Pseudomonadota bacterium]